MYTPVVASCPCCSGQTTPGKKLNRSMQNHGQPLKVAKTSELYRIPLARKSGYEANECITWPRYWQGQFSLDHSSGLSMHEMTLDECRALSIVVLRTSVQQERYGAAHQFNWKKVGLSRAYFKKDLVCEARMPTDRCKAAFRFLEEHNEYYRTFLTHQRIRIENRSSLNLSSYGLFIVFRGIECAMYPVLYPTTDFTDTGIMEHYKAKTADSTSRVVSIGLSWTRKVLSSARVYGEQRDLPFFSCTRSTWPTSISMPRCGPRTSASRGTS